MEKNKKKIIVTLILIIVLIILVPLFILKGAGFSGSDDEGSKMISEINGDEYKPWFTPVLEKTIGGQVPESVETLFFCLQTGIGASIIFFFLGRFVERNKINKEKNNANKDDGDRS